MPLNRNALIRYKTIDNCLRNRYRKWTLDDLIDACSEALYEFEGIDKGVSRRTIQMDLQLMRSEKLGYHAPILVLEKKYYTYEDAEYSITNIPLTDQDLGKLTEVVEILKQFKGFSHFQALSGMVQKLEDKIHVTKTKERPVIDLEKNENLKGLEFIDPIYQAIANKSSLLIDYQSFKARKSEVILFHPALLKEFKNRWFVLGKKKAKLPFMLLALDRIISVESSHKEIISFNDDEVGEFFHHVVGVSVNEGQPPQEVHLQFTHKHAPYVLTKPMHHSQTLIQRNDDGIVIQLLVQLNYELEREILGFGDGVTVIKPQRLRSAIRLRLNSAIDLYETELSGNLLKNLKHHVEHKGYHIVNQIYTRKGIGKVGQLIQKYLQENEAGTSASFRQVLQCIPNLKPVVFTGNLLKIVRSFNSNFFLTKSIFFDKNEISNWFVQWHQDKTIVVANKIEIPGYSGWTQKGAYWGVSAPEQILKDTLTIRIHLDDANEENGALKILSGSHKAILQQSEIDIITAHALPFVCDVDSRGIQLMKPLLLHASSKASNNKKRRVLHLEFNSVDLPNGLEWAEKMFLDPTV